MGVGTGEGDRGLDGPGWREREEGGGAVGGG